MLNNLLLNTPIKYLTVWRRSMKKTLALLTVVFIFSGCAATSMIAPARQPNLAPAADKAIVVIIRDAFMGSPIVFWNYIDGKFIGETKGKTYIITQVTPGKHYLVVATENTAVAQIDFTPGRIYYLREGIAMGIWRARTSGFSPMTPQEAKEAMSSCTYLEIDPKNSVGDMDSKLYEKAIADYHVEVKENPEGFRDILQYQGH
jgi:hypothetical protein